MAYYINGTNPRNSEFVSTQLFRVNSCYAIDEGQGREEMRHEPGLLIRRPEGRRDYQLLYIWRGQGKYLLSGRERLLPAGTVILYAPGVPQIYSYRPEYRCQVGWIHFTGTLAEPLLQRSGLLDAPVAQVGELPEINRLLLRIVRELQRQETQYEDQVTAYFIELVTRIGRRLTQLSDASGYERAQRIREVMEYLHTHYDQALSVDFCAQLCALSRHHFIHVFREFTGLSPYAYLTDVRLSEAAHLLGTTELPVADVARRCGYEDPLYFSRLFKKKYELSPSAFRRQSDEKGN